MKKIFHTMGLDEAAIEVGVLESAAMGGIGHGAGKGGGGGSGNGGGGGKPDGAGSKKGDLFGDQYVLLRDVDPSDGGGNGEPVLDENGNPILIGTHDLPIYFVANIDGDYEIPADQLAFTQTVELERANVARAPEKVMDKSLSEALGKITSAATVTVDAAGRLVCDGTTIDSPLENLALYKYLMTAGGQSSWPAVTEHWPESLQALLGQDRTSPDWDPASLLGAAFSKDSSVTLDAVLYENTVLGVNEATTLNGQLQVDYFEFSKGNQESYSYDRQARYGDVWLQWYEDTDDDPGNLELVQMSLLEAVFDNTDWADIYWTRSEDGTAFQSSEAEQSGVNDFAQAADDARAVIYFMHESGAVQIAPPPTPASSPLALSSLVQATDSSAMGQEEAHAGDGMQPIDGTQFDDLIMAGGGAQIIVTGNGQDEVWAGGGPDVVDAGNGKDLIMGQGGPDDLSGGNGKDILIGGAGPDVLTGGRGADVFVYSTANDASGHQETITDFDVAVDRIDLSAWGSMFQYADGPQAYGIWSAQHDQDAVIFLDTDGRVEGEHPAELSILLLGVNAASLDIDHFVV